VPEEKAAEEGAQAAAAGTATEAAPAASEPAAASAAAGSAAPAPPLPPRVVYGAGPDASVPDVKARAASVSGPLPERPLSPHGRSASVASSPRGSLRQALQTIRAQDLQQEAALLAHASAAEDAYWIKQEERYQQCLRRAQVGATSARDLHHYLKKTSKLLSGVADALTGLGSFGVSGETGTMRVACMSNDIVRKSTASYLGELNARVFAESLQRAHDVAEAADALLSNIESAGNDALKHLKTQRKAAQDAWQNYIVQAQERHALERRGQPLKQDPYLLCRAYELEVFSLRTSEVKFQQLMASLLRDLEAQEAKRLANMKATLLDNLQAQKAVLEHSVKFTDNALVTVQAIDPPKDVQDFTTQADLYLPPQASPRASDAAAAAAASVAAAGVQSAADSTALSAHAQTGKAADALASATPVVAFLAPPPARDPNALARVYAHEIEKEGSLFRQGSVFKSNWKPCHAVVTASGFLHLFSDKSKNRVHSSLSLADCVISNAEAQHGPLALQVTQQAKGGLFSSPNTLYFKADNADELAEWVVIMQRHGSQEAEPAAAAAPEGNNQQA